MRQQDTYVMHAKELSHSKNYARVPRKDSERSKHQVKKYRGHEEYSQLDISLGRKVGVSISRMVSYSMDTHLAERLFALGAVFGKAALFQCALPCTETFELNSHITGGTAFIVLRVDLGTLLEQSQNADLIPAYNSPVQRREAGVVTRVWICTVLKEQFDGERVALIGGPHEGGVPSRIAFIDRNRLVKKIQERHYRGRVGDEVESVVTLRIPDIGVGAMSNE